MTIADRNLRLAALNALVDAGVIVLPSDKELQAEYPPDLDDMDLDSDAEPDEIDVMYTFNAPLAEHLHAWPLTPAQLAGIERIGETARSSLATLLYPQWDGEDELFDVAELAGLEACTGLRELSVRGALADLAPLAGLAKLKELALDQIIAADLAPLLKLPALRSVRVEWSYDAPNIAATWWANQDVIAQLVAKKGMKVDIARPASVPEQPKQPKRPKQPKLVASATDDMPAELAAAIDADPADDAAYRVLGDWLQQRGDVRGELVAIDLARTATGADAKALDKQRKSYVKKHKQALLGPLVDDALEPELEWRYGFLRHAEITTWTEPEKFAAFLGLPITRFLESMKVWFFADDHGADKENRKHVAAIVAAAPQLGALRSLTLESYSDPDSYQYTHGVGDITAVLAAFPRLERVEVAVLATLKSLDLPAVRTFEASPARHLSALLPAICAASWPSLETLYLHALANLGEYHHDPAVRIAEIARLFSAERTPKLRHLRLVDMRFGDALVPALAKSPLLAQLETLDLSETPLSAKAVQSLVAARDKFAHLKRLSVHDTVDNAEAQYAICDALSCASFEEVPD